MKKIVFLTLMVLCSLNILAADSLAVKSSMKPLNTKLRALSSSQIQAATKVLGDDAYSHNDFATAAQIYECVLKTKGEAAEIYYNLGNSYYKLGEISKAILNYERALLLKPGDSDFRANLEIARSKTVDKVNPTPQFFLVNWTNSLINTMGTDSWATTGIIFFILFILGASCFIFSKRVLVKKITFISSLVLLVFVIVANIFASIQKSELENRTNAIVITSSVTVKSTPNVTGTDLFIIHEGHKVVVKDSSMREWKEIKLEDGNVGWVKTTDIEII